MRRNRALIVFCCVLATGVAGCTAPVREGGAGPQAVRLYVFDGGTLHIPDPSRFQLTKADVPVTDLVTPCYLIVHPKGTLIWDACAVPDEEWKATGGPVEHQLQLPDGQTRDLTLRSQLRTQLNSVGYTPSDITYLALSHYHYDHTANADQFGTATWLVRQAEREAMFAENAPPGTRPATYANLRGSKTVVIDTDDYDVFGDGSVVIKSAVGHTPGHQMLFLRLAGTGSVLLCGDLYHYEQERTLDRVPTFEFNADQTRAARTALENFLRQSGAQMWIQHDLTANARLKKAPAFYD